MIIVKVGMYYLLKTIGKQNELIKLQDEIANDEGVKYETYRCSLGHLTGG